MKLKKLLSNILLHFYRQGRHRPGQIQFSMNNTMANYSRYLQSLWITRGWCTGTHCHCNIRFRSILTHLFLHPFLPRFLSLTLLQISSHNIIYYYSFSYNSLILSIITFPCVAQRVSPTRVCSCYYLVVYHVCLPKFFDF